MSNFDYLLKYIIIGDPEIGKSTIMERYAHNTFHKDYIPTIGVDFSNKIIDLNNKTYKIQIWDTSGQEKFGSITTTYYRGCACALVIYDITKRDSFNNVTTWIEKCKNYATEETLIILVGNKSDLNDKRQVSTEEGEDLADKFGILFFEISTITGENVNNVFEKSIEEIQKRIDENYYDLEKPDCAIRRGNK